MTLGSVKSPCNGICTIGVGYDACIGCGRSTNEITCWLSYSDERREEIMQECHKRLDAMFDNGGTDQ